MTCLRVIFLICCRHTFSSGSVRKVNEPFIIVVSVAVLGFWPIPRTVFLGIARRVPVVAAKQQLWAIIHLDQRGNNVKSGHQRIRSRLIFLCAYSAQLSVPQRSPSWFVWKKAKLTLSTLVKSRLAGAANLFLSYHCWVTWRSVKC